jgi:hypothetical protein
MFMHAYTTKHVACPHHNDVSVMMMMLLLCCQSLPRQSEELSSNAPIFERPAGTAAASLAALRST